MESVYHCIFVQTMTVRKENFMGQAVSQLPDFRKKLAWAG